MSKKKLSKLLALYLPYVVIGLLATNLGEAWRLAVGKELGDKIVSLMDEAGLKKLPKAKDLSIEYAELLKKKKEAYPDYRKARDEMQELMKAQKNVEMFFVEEKDTAEKEPTR